VDVRLSCVLMACAWLGAAEPKVLDNGIIHVEVRTDLGGKITSLKDSAGNERLSRSAKAYVERSEGMTYGDSEFDGIDEVFPNLSAETITLADGQTVELPDHGELWTQRWRTLPGREGIHLTVDGRALHYRFERWLTVEDNTVKLDYRVYNTGTVAFPYAYAFHPLFALSDGMSIDVPADQPCASPYAKGGILGPANEVQPWSWMTERLGPLATGNNRYWKVVVHDCPVPVTLRWPDGGSVVMEWTQEALPHAAIWCSEGGVADLQHLACEPSVIRHDRLSAGIADGTARTLAPDEVHTWTITLRLEAPP
jgi:galactose mutarotase-like enzyme